MVMFWWFATYFGGIWCNLKVWGYSFEVFHIECRSGEGVGVS